MAWSKNGGASSSVCFRAADSVWVPASSNKKAGQTILNLLFIIIDPWDFIEWWGYVSTAATVPLNSENVVAARQP
jgi:hypothetical protein